MIGKVNHTKNDYGVSPVVGVILMVALTVMLVAVIGTFLLDLGSQQQEFTTAAVSVEPIVGHQDVWEGQYIMIRVINTGNAERIWVQGDSRDKWLIQDGDTCDYTTRAGDYVIFPSPQDDGFTIYAESSNGELQVIQQESVDTSENTSGSYLTGCGYGDEDRGTLYTEFYDE